MNKTRIRRFRIAAGAAFSTTLGFAIWQYFGAVGPPLLQKELQLGVILVIGMYASRCFWNKALAYSLRRGHLEDFRLFLLTCQGMPLTPEHVIRALTLCRRDMKQILKNPPPTLSVGK